MPKRRKATKAHKALVASMVQAFRGTFPVKLVSLCSHGVAILHQRRPEDVGSPVPSSGSTHCDHVAGSTEIATMAFEGRRFCFALPTDTCGCLCPKTRIVSVTNSSFLYHNGPLLCAREDAAARARFEADKLGGRGYFERTGRRWLTTWPRSSPSLYMHPADAIGTQIVVNLDSQHAPRQPPVGPQPSGDGGGLDGAVSDEAAAGTCANDTARAPVRISMRVLSTKPRLFEIANLLTDEEADELVAVAKPHMDLTESTSLLRVRGFASSAASPSPSSSPSSSPSPSTLTPHQYLSPSAIASHPTVSHSTASSGTPDASQASQASQAMGPLGHQATRQAGVPSSALVDRIIERAAALLRIPLGEMARRGGDNLQIHHYRERTECSTAACFDRAHYDWDVTGGGPSRLLTMLIYRGWCGSPNRRAPFFHS